MDRRKFLKTAGYSLGGACDTTAASPLVFSEKEAKFDPNDSFWARELLQTNPSLQENIKVDIAVIGGGYTGLSTAYHLKKYNPQFKVVVLEAKHVGHGGMILSPSPTESFEMGEEDAELHKRTYDLTCKNMKAIKALIKKSGINCYILHLLLSK